MIDNQKAAKEYVYEAVNNRLTHPPKGEAYQWIIDQIAYYRNPSYPITDYTTEVLNVLEDLVDYTKIPGSYIDKEYMLVIKCKL